MSPGMKNWYLYKKRIWEYNSRMEEKRAELSGEGEPRERHSLRYSEL